MTEEMADRLDRWISATGGRLKVTDEELEAMLERWEAERYFELSHFVESLTRSELFEVIALANESLNAKSQLLLESQPETKGDVKP
jgi:hypothetical protein